MQLMIKVKVVSPTYDPYVGVVPTKEGAYLESSVS